MSNVHPARAGSNWVPFGGSTSLQYPTDGVGGVGTADFEITNGTWTASSRTLTSSGSPFSAIVAGDHIRVTAGTGATTGRYEVESATDANNIVLTTSLAAGDLATGDIEAWGADDANTSEAGTVLRCVVVLGAEASVFNRWLEIHEADGVTPVVPNTDLQDAGNHPVPHHYSFGPFGMPLTDGFTFKVESTALKGIIVYDQ